METVNGVMDGERGGPPPPSPLTGCYLLIVVGEPFTEQHKDIILQRIAKGLLSWDVNDCLVDLEKELAIITEQALEGEEARFGERLIQYASENLVTEILIHPVVSTLAQCMRNLLSSFTRHRHIIHAGYTFAANGSWALQDGTFSFSDFSEAFQELDVQRVIHAYENGISLDLHCSPEGDWTRLPKEPYTKACKVRINPSDVLNSGSPIIVDFMNYLAPFLVPTSLENLLESSDVVGNIRFSRPTLYVFPGGQGDAALFGINGFNMLLDGGYSRKACFWDFVRHLDRLDAVLMTRLNNSNVSGISSVLKRKKQDAVYPQIGHFFCNIQERRAILSPDGDKDKDPLLINLLDEGQEIISNLRHLNLTPQVCYRDSEPINLYHKVGHGTLDMYVLSPAKNSKEVKEFLQKWNQSDQKLFANTKSNRDFSIPIQNLISIAALLVWQPANPKDTITRILYPGSSPQSRIFEGLDRLKNLEFIKHAVCTEKSLTPLSISKKTAKDTIMEKVNQKEKKDNKIENNMITSVNGDSKEKERTVKKSDSTESDRSSKAKKQEEPKIIENGDKLRAKPRTAKLRSDSQQRKKTIDKKTPTPTPKKTVENEEIKKPLKSSPDITPAKSAKDANNRKVIESKTKRDTGAAAKPYSPPEPKTKVERKPISRRPVAKKAPISPAKKLVSGIQKPDSISRKGKLDKEGTTDSSTVSTPSADQETVLKKDLSKLTPEEIQQLKAQELADLKEEQEAVKEIEAVFRKGEFQPVRDESLRKVRDVSIDEKLDKEEYLIIEKEEIEPTESSVEKDTKENETFKLARDSEESEKQRNLSSEDIGKRLSDTGTHVVQDVKINELDAGKVVSSEERLDMSTEKKTTDKEQEDNIRDVMESHPEDKVSANMKSGDTTTAPTLPEDERIPFDETKEDGHAVVEKYVKEETKEKEIPLIQLPQKSLVDTVSKLPGVVGIRLDKQQHIRDIVKTPDEVADLPVHEEVDYEYTHELKAETPKSNEMIEKRFETEENGVAYSKEQEKEVEQEKEKDDFIQGRIDDDKTSTMHEELRNLTKTVLDNESILQTDILKQSEKITEELEHDEKGDGVKKEKPVEHKPSQEMKLSTAGNTKDTESKIEVSNNVMKASLATDTPKPVEKDYSENARHEMIVDCDSKKLIKDEKFSEVREPILETTGEDTSAEGNSEPGKQKILDIQPEQPEETKTGMEARETAEKDEGKQILDLKQSQTPQKPEETKSIMEHEEKEGTSTARDEKEIEETEKDEGKEILDLKEDSSNKPEGIKTIMEHEEKGEKPSGRDERESETAEKDEGKQILDLKQDSPKNPERTKSIMEHEEKEEKPIGIEEKESGATEKDEGKEILDLKEDSSNKPEGTKIIMEHEENVETPIGGNEKESDVTEDDKGKEILDLKEDLSNKPEGTKIIMKHEEKEGKPIGRDGKESEATKRDEGNEILDLKENSSNKPEGTKIIIEHKENVEKPIGGNEKESDVTEDDKGKEIFDLKEDLSNKPEGTKIIMEHEEKEGKPIGRDEKGSEATEKDEGKEIPDLKEDSSNKPEGTEIIMEHEEKEEKSIGIDEKGSEATEKDEGKEILELKEDLSNKPEGTKVIMKHEEKGEEPFGRDERKSETAEKEEGKQILDLKQDSPKKPEGTKSLMEHEEKEEVTIGRNEKESDATEADEGMEKLELKEDSSKKPEGTKAVMEHEEEEEKPIGRNEKDSDATEEDEGKEILDLKEDSSKKPKGTKAVMENEEKEEEPIRRNEKESDATEDDEGKDILDLKEYSSKKPERIKHKMVHEEKEEKTIGRDEKMKSHEFLDECEDVLSVERVKSDFDTKEAEVLKSSKEDKDSLEEIEKKLQHLKQSQIEIEADQTSVTSTEEVAVSNEEILEREGRGTDPGLGEAHGEKTDNVCLAERKIIEMHDVVVKESEVAPEVKEGTFEDEKIEKQLARTEIEESIEKSTDETPNHSISREIVEEGYHISASPELIEKIELGRKSPKEREGDVIKIVASVAEVLKSAASLEEFKGKVPIISIPISSQRKPHTTELRETHITTVDSPIVEYKFIKTDIPTIPEEALTSFLEEERKLAAVHDPEEDKRNILLRESQELMIATSKMISHIKSVKSEEDLKDALPTQQLKETSSENEKKQDEKLEDEEGGVIHRMLVTASSEDGGEETEICPPGTIIYSRSSESSGRSSPDQKMSQKSSIIDTISDTLSTVRQVEEVQDSDEVAQESQVQMIISPEKQPLKGASSKESETLETAEEVTSQLISSGKSSPDKDASIKSLASGKSTPDMSDLEKFRETSSTEDLKKIDDIDRSLQTEETGYIKEKDLPIMYSVSKEMPERSVSEKIEETIEDGVKAITTKSLFSYEKVQDNEGSNIPQGKTTTENNLKVSEKEEDKEKEIRSLDKAGVENTVEDIRKTITRTIDSVIEFIQPTIDHTSSTENLEKHDGVAKVNPDGKYFSEDLKPISVEDYSKEKVLEKSAEKSEDITVAPEKSERSEPMSMTPETKLENDQFIEETIEVGSDKSQQKKDEGKFENSIPEEPAKSIKRTVEDFPEKIKENKVVGHISTREKENIIDVEVELLQHIPEKKTVEEKQKSERTKCSVESVDSRDISDKTTTHSATINLAGKTCTEEISVKIKSEMAEKIYDESEKAIEKSGETPLFQKPVRDIVDKEDNELIQEGMPKKELGYIGEKIKDITEHNRENLAQRVSGEPSENMDYTEMMKEGLKDPVSSLFGEIKDISRKMLDDAKHIFEETTYSISALPDKMTAKTKNINSETKVEQTEQDQTEKTEEDGKGLKHITCDQSEKKETDSFMTEVKEVDYSKVQEDADRKTLDDEESKSTNLTQEYTEKGQLPASLKDNSRIAMRFYDETENSQSTISPKGENVFDSSGTPVKVDVQKYPEESSQICVSEKGTDEKETLKDVKFLDDYTKHPSLSSKLTPELDEGFEEKSIVENVSSSIEKIIKPIASEIDSKIEVSNEKLREKCEKDLTEAGGVIVGKSTEEDGELFENSPETPSAVIIESHIGKDKIIADSTKKTTSDSKAHEDLEEVKSKKLIFEQSTEKLEGVVASKISCWENIQQEEKLDDDIKYKMDPDGVSERTTEEIAESVLTERKKSASEVSQDKSIDGCLKLSEEIVKQEETMISESAKDIETTFESVKDMTKAVIFETCPNPKKKDECEIEQQILKDEVITQTTEISHIKPVNDLGNKLGTIQNLLQHKESVSNDSAVTLRKTSASGKAEQEEENTKSSRDLEESLETVQNSTESITLDKYESTEKKRSFDNETVRNLKQSHHEKKISEDEKTEKDVEVITKHLLKKETIAKIGDQPTSIVFDESIATEARTIIGESTTMVEEILHRKSEAEKEIDDAKGDSNSISKGGERFDSDGTIKILEASNKLNAGKKDIKKEDIKIHEETFETIIPAINDSMKSGSLILQMDKSDADKIIDKKKEPVKSESKIHQVKLLESSEKSDVRRLGIDEIIDEKNDYIEPHEEACEEKLEETSRITSAADDSMGSEKEVIHEGTYKTKYVVDAFLEKSDVEKLYIDGEEKPVELHEETSRITSAVDDSMESRKEVMQVKSVEYTEDPNSNAGKVGKHIDVKENSEKLPKETSKTTPGVESNKESARVPGASFKNVTLLEEEEYLNNILGGAVVKSDMSKSVHLGRETISDVGQDIATLKQKHHEESETTKQFIRDSEITKMMEHDENISDKVDQKYSDAEQKTEIVTISSKSAVSDDISRSKLDSEESTLQHMKQDAKKHHYEDAQPDTTACTTELSLEQSTKDLENTLEAVEGLSQSVVFEKCESTKTTTSVGDVSTKDIQHVKTHAVEEYDEAILEQSARDLEDTFETVKNMSQSLIFRKCDSTETKVSTEDLSLKALKEYTTEKPLDEHEVIQKLTKEQEATHKQFASDLKDISQSITAKDQEVTNAAETLIMETKHFVVDIHEIKGKQPVSISSKSSGVEKGKEETMEKGMEEEINLKDKVLEKTSSVSAGLSTTETLKEADLQQREIQATLLHEKHIPGAVTPPTVPVSPNILDETVEFISGSQASTKDIDLSGVSDIITQTENDIPSKRLAEVPLGVVSQVPHPKDASHDFDDARTADPMSVSLYGSLPGDSSNEQYVEPTHLFEITKAKYSAISMEKTGETTSGGVEKEKVRQDSNSGQIVSAIDLQTATDDADHFGREQMDMMTASFYGNLPSADQDPISSWGKPLGLPSPAPPNDNKGTPKKERKLPLNVSAKNKLNDERKRAESPSKNYKNRKITPVYVDLTYVPHHGNTYYSYIDFFRRVRARYYVFSGIEPSREVYNALLEAKQSWEDKDLEVTIIPTYDTDILGYWVAENEELLTKYKIDLSPSASRCTINLQDHETSCSAYRLEF